MDASDVTCAILARFAAGRVAASRALRVILRDCSSVSDASAWNTVPTGLYAMAFR